MEIQIVRSRRKTLCLEITSEGQVLARAPLRMPRAQILRFVEEKADWIEAHLEKQRERSKVREQEGELTGEQLSELTRLAKEVLPGRAEYFAQILGVTYGRITIRNQKTRWGSCSSAGNLNFNCQLMRLPAELQDYVVVHELCHRKEMNHSPGFWALVEQVLPDYRERRKKLREQLL